MTPDSRKTLLGLISEYGSSLSRIVAEKELIKVMAARAAVVSRIAAEKERMKVMAARAAAECAVPEADFKRVAMAYWRDATSRDRMELSEVLEAFEKAAGSDG